MNYEIIIKIIHHLARSQDKLTKIFHVYYRKIHAQSPCTFEAINIMQPAFCSTNNNNTIIALHVDIIRDSTFIVLL